MFFFFLEIFNVWLHKDSWIFPASAFSLLQDVLAEVCEEIWPHINLQMKKKAF